MQKARIDEIDILRGLLFLAIAFQHTLASFIYNPTITKGPAIATTLLLILVRLAVPMFIFITGLVIFYNYGDGEFHYSRFISKRFSQVFIPYFVWTCIYFVWTSLTVGTPPNSPGTIVATIVHLTLTGEACYHLWFMAAILQFYLLFPLFRYLVIKTKNQAVFTLVLCFLVQIWLLWFYQYSAPTVFEHINSPLLKELYQYRDRIFISWFFYFILGGFVGLNVTKLPGLLRRFQGVIILVFSASLALVLYQMLKTAHTTPAGGYLINNMFSGPLNYMMAVYILASLALAYHLALTLFSRHQMVINVMETFGRYSFGCYFVHAFVLALVTAFTKTNLLWMGMLMQIFVSFAACSILSLGVCMALNKVATPFGTVLVGKVPPMPVVDHTYVQIQQQG